MRGHGRDTRIYIRAMRPYGSFHSILYSSVTTMLIQRFRGTKKFLLILFIFILTCAIYGEYRSRDKQTLSAVAEKRKIKTRYKLIIVVISTPKDFERRETVRRTWQSENYKNVKYLFAVGILNAGPDLKESLITEQKKNHDLLLLPSLWDSYETLTKKVLQSVSQIYNDFDFDYVLKCDDDSFVVVDRVLKELDKWEVEATGKELYWGFFDGAAPVEKTGRWKEDNWIFCDLYLPYALGGGYVLSYRLIQFIAQNSDNLRIQNSEDVSVGLWLAPLSNVERKHDVRFNTEQQSRGCSNEYIITHKQNSESMNNIQKMYNASGVLCVKEFMDVNGYKYDWSVPPSQCCIRKPGIP